MAVYVCHNHKQKTNDKIKAKLTSQEIVWATERRPPNIEEDQPATVTV
jgi:hypothetical protein